jgi:hypothetical protein
MKYFLPSLVSIMVATHFIGCSGTSAQDAGADSSTDATTDAGNSDASDGAPSDAAPNDTGVDAPTEAGNLDAGASCNPKDDQCGPGLKCCAGGISTLDGGAGHCVVPTDAGTCPILP